MNKKDTRARRDTAKLLRRHDIPLVVNAHTDAFLLQPDRAPRLSHGPFPHRHALQALGAYARHHTGPI